MHRCHILLKKATKTIAAKSKSKPKPKPTSTSLTATAKAKAAAAKVVTSSGTTGTDKGKEAILKQIPLYHHVQPTLFPRLQPGTRPYLIRHVSSSMSAAYSLLRWQESRDRFRSLINGNGTTKQGPVINTIIRQSFMGMFKRLTLYQDLCHPLFHGDGCRFSNSSKRMHKVDIHEFMMGCRWALEHFHRTKEELLVKPFSIENMDWRTPFIVPHIASQDPTSLEYHFIQMTTPTIFEPLRVEGIHRLVKLQRNRSTRRVGKATTWRTKWYGWDRQEYGRLLTAAATEMKTTTLPKCENIRVRNVALLSARVREIYPPPPSRPTSPFDHRKITNKEAQVITQLEVLYELQQNERDDHGGNNKETTLVMVGTFEACLEGDPNHRNRTDGGEDDNATTTTTTKHYDWKLAHYREAHEFIL